MELYTIDMVPTFPAPTYEAYFKYDRDQIIDEYESLVWTERFTEPGDYQLVIPATKATVALLRPGTLLGVNTSRELMLCDTRSIKDGVLTSTGKTIEKFFDERIIDEVSMSDTPGNVLERLVEFMQEYQDGYWAIPGLRTGDVADTGSTTHIEKMERGGVHSALLKIAQKYKIGMKVEWLKKASGVGHELVFSTRFGDDRSSEIIFDPALDNFANVSELDSDVDEKSVIVVFPPTSLTEPGHLAEDMEPVQVSNVSGTDWSRMPFKKRVMEINSDDISADDLGSGSDAVKLSRLANMMTAKGTQALEEHKKKRIVDGEAVPQDTFRYYSEYNPENSLQYRLGDLVSVGGNFTEAVKGVVTEYIQTSDGTGSRAYPTIAQPADPVPEGGAS